MDEEVAEGKRDKQSETERIQKATVGGTEREGGREGEGEEGGQTDGEMSRMQ